MTSSEIVHQQLPSSGECSICLEGNLNLRTHCGHNFHGICLIEWAKRKFTCPLCRVNLKSAELFCTTCHLKYRKINVTES